MQKVIFSAAVAAAALSSLATAQTVTQIPAMTVPTFSSIDFDNVNGGVAGPVTVAQINAGGTPAPALIGNITLTANTTVAGVYNTNPQGLGLGLSPSGTGMELISDANGAFASFDSQIDLLQPSTEFGVNVGDWIGPVICDFYLAGTLQTTFTTTSFAVGSGPILMQMQGGQFDRVDVKTQVGGNWVFTELVIEGGGSGLFPAFAANTTAGPSPLTVNFTDGSYSSDPGGILAWIWDVDGDGTPDYNTQNCTHTYASCGNYDVELSVLDASHGLVSLRKNNYISVDPITAAFTFSSLGNNAVQFTDTTVGATSWMWDFDGNGTIDSTQQSPQHTYPAGGFYNASLTASNGCNSNTITQNVPTFGLLCTITTGGNGLTAVGSGNYFDINVTNPNGVLITGIEVDAYVATTGNVDVWTVPNSYIGNETNAAAWTNVSSATNQTLSAVGTLDFIDVPDFYLAPGSHGMYIQTAGGVSYTNGNGTNQTFSNGDMTLTLGASSTNFGSPITPRVWNGCIYYDTNPTGVYFAHKPGCAGSAGVTGNVAATGTAPKINTTFIAELSPMPASGVGIMIFSIDDTQWNGLPLPVSLAQFGAPGCFGNVNPESTTLVIGPGGGTGNWNLTIPNVQAFVGTPFFTQALMIDPGVNTLGGVMSDSAKGIVGQ